MLSEVTKTWVKSLQTNQNSGFVNKANRRDLMSVTGLVIMLKSDPLKSSIIWLV